MDSVGVWVTSFGGAALVVWLAMLLVERRLKRELRLFTWILGLMALSAIITHHGARIPEALTGERVHVWNQYHYYVGSKYFGELGYFDLYAATLTADDDFLAAGGAPDKSYSHVGRSRDMHSYELLPREEIVGSWDRSVFTEERLAELGADSRWIRALTPDKKARRMLSDLGYNPAPPWVLLGKPVAELVELGGPLYPVITASDLAMVALALLALWWGFGARAAFIGAIWLHLAPMNLGRMSGTFFNYDWLAASAVAMACWHKDRPKLAGVALSWAAMTRVFPGLIALPVVIRTGWDLVVRRKRPEAKRLAFTIAFCAACGFLFVASHGTGRGLGTWLEWKEKIVHHSATHATTGSERVGLARLVRHQPDDDRFWRSARRSDGFEATAHRRKQVAVVLGLALLLAALWRRPDHEAMLAMLFAGWMLTTSSRYYASIWLLLFTLPRRSTSGVVAAVSLLGMLVTFHLLDRRDSQYLLLNYEAGLMFVGLCVCYLLASRRRPDDDV
jgi:hypothetical protein